MSELIPFAVAEIIHDSSISTSLSSSSLPPTQATVVIEERISLVTKDISEKDILISSLREEMDKLKSQYLPLLGDSFFKE